MMPVGEQLVDPQPRSALLQLPIELRRHIYTYIVPTQVHIYIDQGIFHIAACITTESSNDYYCFDRRSTGDPSTETWARRLSSPWGGHWKCEEVAKLLNTNPIDVQIQHDSIRALMCSCRKTYEDVTCILAETSVIRVVDLTTLSNLFQREDHWAGPERLFARAFSHTRRLNLSFRLPVQVYKAIEEYSLQSTEMACSPTTYLPVSWMRAWHNISTLLHLQSINLTLDHDSELSWSVVNEDAILSTLQPLVLRPQINTTIHMPKVHRSNLGSNLAPFPIRRYVRQRLFTEYRKDGSIGVIYEEDAYKSFHTPGLDSAGALRAAELTTHVWFQGIDLDYVAMDEDLDATCYAS